MSSACASTSLRSASGLMSGLGAGLPTMVNGCVHTCIGSRLMIARARDAGQRAHALEQLVVEDLRLRRHQVHVVRRLVEVLRASEQDVGRQEPRRCRSRAGCAARAGSHASSGRRRREGPSTARPRRRGARCGRGAARRSRPRAPSLSTSLRSSTRRAQRRHQAEDEARDDRDRRAQTPSTRRVDLDVPQQLRKVRPARSGRTAACPRTPAPDRSRSRRPATAAGSR